ncbi:uncharacterized protein LOC105838777 isoform X4 [Monomorium pharaonis]|uniref:uncharacterized protein LOC105838777 isoform X4 n=2 Tax=Monomorium pharaonis TaxID=307658 RepID=UPI00174720A2|nr:uncharacterized protein LOC105838777 isoform X4 [Monomorium pharaonis]
MSHKPPIRTYQRKKTANKPSVPLLTLPAVSNRRYNCMENHSFNKSETCNNSLNYDLFETTFDRIAKGAVRSLYEPKMTYAETFQIYPMALLISCRVIGAFKGCVWSSGNCAIMVLLGPRKFYETLCALKSPTIKTLSSWNWSKNSYHCLRFIYIPVCLLCHWKIKTIPGRTTVAILILMMQQTKRKDYEPEIMISSGILSKRTRIISRKDKLQIEKAQGQKTQTNKIQRKKTLKDKFKSSRVCNGQISNITKFEVTDNLKDTLYKNDFKRTANYQQIIKPCSVKLNIYTVQNYMLNREKLAESKQDVSRNTKFLYTNTLQTNRDISQIQNTISRLILTDLGNFKHKSIKQCSVALNDNNVKDWYVLNNKENMDIKDKSIDIRDKSSLSYLIFHNSSEAISNYSKSIEHVPNNIRKNRNLMKDCFVRLERLRTTDFVEESNAVFNKKEQNIVSSTPIGSRVKPSTCLVIFSPINSNINDKFHWNQKYSLTTAKENIFNIDQRDCYSSVDKTQIQVLLSQKSRDVSMNSIVKNGISYEDDIYMAQKLEIPHSLNMFTACSANQSQSLFGNTMYNNLTKDTDEDNVVKKNFSDKFVKMDLVDLSTDLHLKREYLLNSKALSNTREISKELLKNKHLQNYNTAKNIVKAKKNKNETININRYSFYGEGQDNVNNVDARVLLTRLQDSVRIGKRTQYPKWHLSMSNVSNNKATQSDDEILCAVTTDKDSSVVEYDSKNSRNTNKFSLDCFELFNGTTRQHNDSNRQMEKSVFLKPGKSWARSLSILSNVNDEDDLDKLSVGKGKKWRRSVRNILNMQKQGIFQSCLKEDRNDTDLSRFSASNVSLFNNNRCKEFNLANHARFSKRVSMRVVPNNTSIQCDVEDTPFLEAFGITAKKSLQLKLLHQEDSLIHDDRISSHFTTARDVVLQRCSQKCYMSFAECFPDSYLEHCHKIGEGVYGEVFLYECNDKKSVIKIIPIENDKLVNGEPQKKFSEILSEIVIAKELDNLRLNITHRTNGFVEVKNVSCIIGKYPEKLIELWNIYDNDKTSDNDCPTMFSENQLYIALELGHGGEDLEAFVFQTGEEAHALFLQTALTLAVAEKALEFEHRDLHWGNILISRTKEPYIYYSLDEKEIKFPSKGIKVSIIDFTLSRMLYQGCCIYNDLSLDPALFTAHGEYQFEIYRLMRDKLQNNWQKFEPYTNVLWLHYVLDKMIMAVRYKKKNLKIHKQALIRLKELKNTILNYDSAYDFVINSNSIVY